MNASTLASKRVVIIGGSSGIGYAVAEGAALEGARVVIGSSNPANVAAAVARLGGVALGHAVDVSDDAGLANFFAAVGDFDHLVFPAGDGDRAAAGGLANFDFAAAAESPKIRFWGALKAVKQALSRLSAEGSITLTDGVLAHRPMKGALMSTAFGGALEHLARGLAVELAPIRVNAVCPGLVLTERIAAWPGEILARFIKGQPIERGAEPVEVAQAYLYLMKAGYTTGQVLVVDGGRTLI